MADACGGIRRPKPETLPRRQAVALIARHEPQMPIETIELALWRGIWRGAFDDGLWLVELDGKARPYTRRMLAWQLAQVGVGDYRLGDIGYRPPPRDQDGRRRDLAKGEADWDKLAAWPLDAYGLLDVAFQEAVVDRLEVGPDALWTWWADEAKRLVGQLNDDTKKPAPGAEGERPKQPLRGAALGNENREAAITAVVSKYRAHGLPAQPGRLKKIGNDLIAALKELQPRARLPRSNTTLNERWPKQVLDRLEGDPTDPKDPNAPNAMALGLGWVPPN
jgi:hypothetical protein